MAQSLLGTGSDEEREKVRDICCNCASSDKIQPATHFCFECGVFGRYLCATCLEHHNLFGDHQDVNHIGGQTNSRIQKKDDELRKLDGDMKQLKTENERVNKQLQAAILDRDGRQHIAERLETQNVQINAENDKLLREKKKIEVNFDIIMKQLKAENERVNKQLQAAILDRDGRQHIAERLETQNVQINAENDKLLREKRKIEVNFDIIMKQLKAENERVNKQLQAAILYRDGRQHIAERLETQNVQINAENDKLLREKKKMEVNFDALLRETNEKSQQLQSFQVGLEKTQKDYKRKLDALEENHERDIRTMKGNLSDVMKERDDLNTSHESSEKFGTLYDDEWTDVFEELKKKKVPIKDSVQFLLNVLQDCLKFCNNLKETQIDSLSNVLLHPSQDVKKFAMGNRKQVQGLKEKPRISSKDEKAVRALRRLIGVSNTCLEEVKQLFVMETKSWDKCRYDKKHLELCEPYLQKCAEICWLMVLHDPPLHMKTDAKSGDKMDSNLYTVYSSSGEKIDYLVWPPLYNEVGGGLISKGVAECTKTTKKK